MTVIFFSAEAFNNDSNSSLAASVDVGLLGLHKITASISGVKLSISLSISSLNSSCS